ncbi:hypothetical protein [Nonomuraea sp. NPDC050643]|uniref:hypothetical protein n=1 Tax=Nonomuraea sp. NPDC050643 TaxID=3155660 RepID=UPI0033F19FD0
MSIAYRLEERFSPEAEWALGIDDDPVTERVRHTVDLLRSGDPRAEDCLRGLADQFAAGDHLAVRLVLEAIGVLLAVRAGREDTAGLDTPASPMTYVDLAPGRCPQPERGVVVCRREDDRWRLSFGGRTALAEDGVGMRSLAVLIANPGRAIDAVDLATHPALPDEPARDAGGTSSMPDDRTTHVYREHLSWLRAEIDDLESAGATWRTGARRAERDRVAAALAAATRLGGDARPRTDQELVGMAIGQAVRRTLTRIATADAVIGDELRATVRVGVRCSYRPR